MHDDDDDDDESWIGAETSGKTCWAARVEPGGARVRVYAASIDDHHDDDDDDDDDDAECRTGGYRRGCELAQ